ncbi:MAG: hypothetical protein A4E62_00695 [Syntrophorhabdus sp. PtaU1.Bin002]|nr:MAG: hypothetical protein A4E62_00695 [Syntrophorhabdus sp. PtaU1.Bin002]
MGENGRDDQGRKRPGLWCGPGYCSDKFTDYDGGCAPYFVATSIKVGDLYGLAANYPFLKMNILLTKKVAERYLQQFCHLVRLGGKERAVREVGNIGMDTEVAWRDIERGKGTQDTEVVTAQSDLFASLAQGCVDYGRVLGFEPSPWKADLTFVIGHCISTASEHKEEFTLFGVRVKDQEYPSLARATMKGRAGE